MGMANAQETGFRIAPFLTFSNCEVESLCYAMSNVESIAIMNFLLQCPFKLSWFYGSLPHALHTLIVYYLSRKHSCLFHSRFQTLDLYLMTSVSISFHFHSFMLPLLGVGGAVLDRSLSSLSVSFESLSSDLSWVLSFSHLFPLFSLASAALICLMGFNFSTLSKFAAFLLSWLSISCYFLFFLQDHFNNRN